jgi:hypothetical protein
MNKFDGSIIKKALDVLVNEEAMEEFSKEDIIELEKQGNYKLICERFLKSVHLWELFNVVKQYLDEPDSPNKKQEIQNRDLFESALKSWASVLRGI